MIVVVGGEKGGTGKTTLATNLAVHLKLSGSDILLVDTDKQASASAWCGIRSEIDNCSMIPCVQQFGNNVSKSLLDLKNRYDDVVVDAGGRDSVELRSSMAVADKLYIPLQASQFDVWTLSTMDKLVSTVKSFNPNLEAYVVINRASPNPAVSEALEAKDIFEEFENLSLCHNIIKDRIAYRKAARAGLAVFELTNIDQKAVEEINEFYKEVMDNDKAQKPAA